jgi:ribonuclease J
MAVSPDGTAKTEGKAGAKARNKDEQQLVFVPLGGAGEIGMNVYLYGLGTARARDWLMVDLGITFPSEAEPGVDVVLPDLRFIEGDRKRLHGLVLTHAHEDHFGAVMELWPKIKCPIYATPFTAALLKAKARDDRYSADLPIKVVELGGRVTIGPFDVEFVSVAHSIPEPNALAIRTPLGMVVHTGDWKIDAHPVSGLPTNEKRLRELGDEGVAALMCDSTNALRDGISPSEEEVGRTLAKLIAEAPHRVAVTSFASNVARMRSIAEGAHAAGRDVVVAGRAMHRILQIAQETGYMDKTMKFHDQQAFGYIPRDKVVAMCTGSQGEVRAAMARIAAREHPEISLQAGDRVIFSSRPIPGNERGINRMLNGLADQGIEIITDAEALVHVTGHPRRGELKQMYAWTRPAVVVPMHGEPRHLMEQARFAKANGVPHSVQARNGTVVKLLPGPATIIDEVPVGRLFRDGQMIVDGEDGPVRGRRKLSFAGIIVLSLVLDKLGAMPADPDVVIEGIPDTTPNGEAMEDFILDAVESAINSIPKGRRKDIEVIREAANRAARSAVNEVWGKKPICKVMIAVV